MTSFGTRKIRTKLFTAFAAISILIAAAGYLQITSLLICATVAGICAGAVLSTGISNRITQLADMTKSGREELEALPNDEIGEVAASIKDAIASRQDLAGVLTRIARGDYSDGAARAGDDPLGKAVQLCATNGRLLEQELLRIREAMSSGRLRERCRSDKTQGSYNQIIGGVNDIIDMLVRAPGKAIHVLTKVVDGDLTARFNGEFSGDHATFQNAVNLTVKTLDGALMRVGTAAEQVSAASHQISSGSQTLSQRATEQASSIEEVSSSLHEVAAMTKQNSENAKQARSLSRVAETSVEAGVESMRRLSEAIDRIKTSSDSTAKIIKTIDEIAFQTNLLALNAAVEAARAGDAGKGFAVVAEEVRNLAMRSAEAAKNTANLIEESVRNSENGVALNVEVLKNLNDIYGQVKKVGAVMEEIAEASEQQTQGVEQVNTVINQMNVTTQQVAANAEESAGGAQELSGQAEELRHMVQAFRLSGNSDGAGSTSRSRRAPGPEKKPLPGDAFAPSAGQNVRMNPAKLIPFDEDLALGEF